MISSKPCRYNCNGNDCLSGTECTFLHDEVRRQAALEKKQQQEDGATPVKTNLKSVPAADSRNGQYVLKELDVTSQRKTRNKRPKTLKLLSRNMEEPSSAGKHDEEIFHLPFKGMSTADCSHECIPAHNDLAKNSSQASTVDSQPLNSFIPNETLQPLNKLTYSRQEPNSMATLVSISDHMRQSLIPDIKKSIITMDFPQFSNLPTELRLKIWAFILQRPRCVKLKLYKIWATVDAGGYDARVRGYKFKPSPTRTLVPPLLSVNRESREVALKTYKLHFNTTLSKAKIYFNMEVDCLLLNTRSSTEFPVAVANLSEETMKECTTLVVRCGDYLHSPWMPLPGFCESLTAFKSLKRLILLTTEEERDERQQIQFHGKEAEWIIKQDILEWIRDWGDLFGRSDWKCPKIYLQYG